MLYCASAHPVALCRYSDADESTAAYGRFSFSPTDKFEWSGVGDMNVDVDDMRSRPLSDFRSGFDRSYPYPGFGVVLPNHNASRALQMLKELRTGRFFDEATRAVLVQATFFNPQLDMWVLFQFMLEVPKTGGVIQSRTYQTVKLYTFAEDRTTSAIVLEVRAWLPHFGHRGRCA